jgi:hypothetical protein
MSYYHIMKQQVAARDGNKYLAERIPRTPCMVPLIAWITAHDTGIFSMAEMQAALPKARVASSVALLLARKELKALGAGMYKRSPCKS